VSVPKLCSFGVVVYMR